MNEQEAIILLRKYANSKKSFENVLAHSKKVQEIALRIAKQIPNVDLDFIKIASLLHDIGRFGADALHHGVRGAEILHKEGISQYASVAERHLGGGISKQEIIEQKLDLPLKDYMPTTVEEKIITHADNLVCHDREISFEETIERFKKELNKKAIRKFFKLKDELEALKRS
jgi:uncharacterized protein (TIGR00295 family)